MKATGGFGKTKKKIARFPVECRQVKSVKI